MHSTEFTDADIQLLHADLEKSISAEFARPSGAEGLKLVGTLVAGFIATKVLLPVLCGFTSRFLYDRYKDIQVTSQAERAREDLLTAKPINDSDRVASEVLEREMTEKLMQDGLNEHRARTIVIDLIRKVEDKSQH
jgi:hypothetical protein